MDILKVRMAAGHLRLGKRFDSKFCAGAEAIKDAFHAKGIFMSKKSRPYLMWLKVTVETVELRLDGDVFRWESDAILVTYRSKYNEELPNTLADVVRRFEASEPVHPCDFTLDPAQAEIRAPRMLTPAQKESNNQNLAKAREAQAKGIRSGTRRANSRVTTLEAKTS